jgi:hypothetical protein
MSRRVRVVGYPLLADSHTFTCGTGDDLATKPVWARRQGYRTAKARRADGYLDRPLCPQSRRGWWSSHAPRA